MHERGSNDRRISRLFRLMAMLLVFVVSSVTVAEAAECVTEPQTAELMLVSDAGTPDEAPSQDDAGDHGICPHGHCHNGSATAARVMGFDGSADLLNSSFSGNADQFALSAHSSRLKRPPRV